MIKNFFVYGTLLFPEIIFALTKKQFKNQDAVLKDYKRCKIFDNNTPRAYPAILKSIGNNVNGKIIFDVDKKSAKILDFFEDVDYEKKILTVQSGNKNFKVIIYVWKNEHKYKLKSEWDEEEFKKKYLDLYANKKIPKILSEYDECQK